MSEQRSRFWLWTCIALLAFYLIGAIGHLAEVEKRVEKLEGQP